MNEKIDLDTTNKQGKHNIYLFSLSFHLLRYAASAVIIIKLGKKDDPARVSLYIYHL